MKATVLGFVALALGIATGIGVTRHEFSREVAPIEAGKFHRAASGSASSKIGPKVTIVNGERHDFGSMERNAHGTHAFIVRNDGDATLTLATGQPSCGVCVKFFGAAKERLEPG